MGNMTTLPRERTATEQEVRAGALDSLVGGTLSHPIEKGDFFVFLFVARYLTGNVFAVIFAGLVVTEVVEKVHGNFMQSFQ